jgi:lysozyme family protein
MLKFTDPLFQKYAAFVGHAEGGLSKNPNDSAARFVEPGQYHTNRGIIWPTFQTYAKSLGIPATYDNFIKLSKEQANQILYAYYKFASKDIQNDITGLILTNIYWGSGNVLGRHTRLALRELGIPVKITGNLDESVRRTINLQDPAKFNDALMKVRRDFLTAITISRPANKVFLKGWLAREDRFKNEFMTGSSSPEKKNSIAWLAFAMIGGFLFFKEK